MSNQLKEQITEKLDFHRGQVKKYEAALKLMESNPDAVEILSSLITPEPPTGGRRGRNVYPVTLRTGIVEALTKNSKGLTPAGVRQYMMDTYEVNVPANTMSTALAKTRREGDIKNVNGLWVLAKGDQKKSA